MIGIKIQGMKNIGFKIIGIPKINGSLTLKIPGANANLPIPLNCFDLVNITITIITTNVQPVPPKPTTNVSTNVFVMIFGRGNPALNALKLSAAFGKNKIPSNTEFIITVPCKPKNQKNCKKKIVTIIGTTPEPNCVSGV